MSAEERAAKTATSCSAPSCLNNCASTGVGCGENQRLALSRQPLAYCESPDRRKNAIPRLPRSREARGSQSGRPSPHLDRKSTRLNSSHQIISYAVFCLKKKNKKKSTRAY